MFSYELSVNRPDDETRFVIGPRESASAGSNYPLFGEGDQL